MGMCTAREGARVWRGDEGDWDGLLEEGEGGGRMREGGRCAHSTTYALDGCVCVGRERERGCWLRWMVPPMMVSATHIDVRRWGWLCGCSG